MNKKIHLLVALILVCVTFAANMEAQNKARISGKVMDEQGEPLAGVNVVIRSTNKGTTTDSEGRFEIAASDQEVWVEFSFIGFQSQKRKAAAGAKLIVKMKEDSEALDQSVVIGYNVVRKSDLTGSVSSVKSEAFENKTVASVEDGLKGQVAGVSIITFDGTPGEKMDIRIRGANSINASNTPLYVVDGVLLDASEVDLSPGEVATMDILKDASSTAIYGSRGANGVVIITTKRGTKGRAKISFDSQVTVQQPVRLYKMMNTQEYAQYRWLGWGSLTYRPTGTATSSQLDLVDFEGVPYRVTLSGNSYSDLQDKATAGELPNTDWQSAMLRNSYIREYQLNISGADDKTTYSLMGGIFKQDGVVIASDYDRYSTRLNLDRKVTNSLKVGVNLSGLIAYQNSPVNNIINTMLSQPPSKKEQATETESAPGEDITINNNPIYQAQHIKNERKQEKISAKAYGEYQFLKIFKLNISGVYSDSKTSYDRYYPSNTSAGKTTKGAAIYKTQDNISWQNENLLYIVPKPWGNKGKHRIDGLLGVTFSGWDNYGVNAEVDNFEYEGLGSKDYSFGTVAVLPTNSITHITMLSYLARVNYTLNKKYLFTAAFRSDGSSRFATNHKWAYFPSGAVAWKISDEPFIKELNVFSNLKLRASAGQSGNTGISPYQTLATMSSSPYPMNGTDPSFGVTANRVANPDLKWETTTQYDLGLESGFFNNRLTAEVDLYYKRTRDLLLVEDIPNYLGYKSRWTNKGKVDNKGLEITLVGTPVSTKDFTWNSNFNIAFNRSKVLYINEGGMMYLSNTAMGASNFNVVVEGCPLGVWYGYKVTGIYKSESELKASGIKSIFDNTDLRPGYLKYEDVNKDNVINEADRQVLGYAEPKFTGGFNNTFTYKDLSLYVGMEFRYGGKVFNATRMSLENGKGARNQSERYAMFHYVPTLYRADNGELFIQGNEDVAYLRTAANQKASSDYICSSLYVEDGSYIRLSDISLSYKLPEKVSNTLKLQGIRVFASVKNAYLFTKYSGYDPDVNMAGQNKDLAPGLDSMAYPRTRSYTFGINFTF